MEVDGVSYFTLSQIQDIRCQGRGLRSQVQQVARQAQRLFNEYREKDSDELVRVLMPLGVQISQIERRVDILAQVVDGSGNTVVTSRFVFEPLADLLPLIRWLLRGSLVPDSEDSLGEMVGRLDALNLGPSGETSVLGRRAGGELGGNRRKKT